MIDYSSIELNEQEIKEALLEAKKKKYFHLKHKHYWDEKINNSKDDKDSIKQRGKES